jgi:hypothetical protein
MLVVVNAKIKVKVKGEVYLITGHKGPEGE